MLTFQDVIQSPQWPKYSTDQRQAVLQAWADMYGVPEQEREKLLPYTWKSTQGAQGIFPAIASGGIRGLTAGLVRPEDILGEEEAARLRAASTAHPVATMASDMAAFMVPVSGMSKAARLVGLGAAPTLAKIPMEAGAFSGLDYLSDVQHGTVKGWEDYAKGLGLNLAMVGAGRGLGKLLSRGGEAAGRKLTPEERAVVSGEAPEPQVPVEQPPGPSSPGAFSWADLAPGMAENEAMRLQNVAMREELARRFSEALPEQQYPGLRTSNFAEAGRYPNAVSIAQKTPKWFEGRRYPDLAPTSEIRKLANDPEAYAQAYKNVVLSKLDPHQVARELGPDAILLCYERPGEFCHRRLVAEWLGEAGYNVPELPSAAEGHPAYGEYYRQKALTDAASRWMQKDAAGLKGSEFLNEADLASMLRGATKGPETFPFQRTEAEISAPQVVEPRKWSIKDATTVIERTQKGEPTTLKLDPAYGQSLGLPSDEVLVKEVTPNGFKVETANGDTMHLQFDKANKTIPGVIGVEHRDTQFPAAPETPMAGAELRAKEEPVPMGKEPEGLTVQPATDALDLPGGNGLYSEGVMDEASRRFREWEAKGEITPEAKVHLEDVMEGRATLPEIMHKLDGGKNLLETAPEPHLRRIVTDWLENKIVSKEAATEAGTPIDRYNNIKYTIDNNQRKFIDKIMRKGVTPKDIDTLREMEVQRRLNGYAKLLDDIGEPAKVEGKALKLEDGTTLEKPKDVEQVTQKIAEETTFTDSKPNQEVASLLNC